jgi:hypothetical protein
MTDKEKGLEIRLGDSRVAEGFMQLIEDCANLGMPEAQSILNTLTINTRTPDPEIHGGNNLIDENQEK